MILANPNKEELNTIAANQYRNLNLKLRFNAISEASFEIYQTYKNPSKNRMIRLPYYNLLRKNRLIKIENFGWFVIKNVDESLDGNVPSKSITCYSFEYTLNSKGINLLDGTYKFYDPISPTETLLGTILTAIPNWKIGYVDSDLWNKYRTFEIPASTIYGFLMSNVEKAYECIFEFDSELQTINAYSPKNIVKDTDISLSFDNLVKDCQINETDDDIITALAVFGSGDLDIRNVNPLGTPYIYNFDDKKHLEWMEQSLINSINLWEDKIKLKQVPYSDTLSILKTKNGELIKLNGTLVDLQGKLKAQEGVRTAQSPNILAETTNLINSLNSQIFQKNAQITAKKNEIEIVNSTLKTINDTLKFENNFTASQLIELSAFIFEGSYVNENYVQTDIMNAVDIQEMSMQLYEQGQGVLLKASQPNFTFSLNTVNFLFTEKFKPFTKQLTLGSLVNVNIDEDEWVYPVLLELSLDFENPDNFNMTFGNRFRLDSAEWTFADLYNEQNKVVNTVISNGNIWNKPVKSGLVDEVSLYMKENLQLGNQIIQSKDQSFTMGDYGLRGTKKLPDGNFDPHQIWINNNLIMMTDNNWQTSKLAIGMTSNGKYSIIADVIAGKMVASNDLLITNENNKFRVDANGAELVDAKFLLTTSNNKGRIILNPNDGIKIQTNPSGTWKDVFYVDTNGDLVMAGKLTSTSGSIGGIGITANGLSFPNGDYMNANGYGKISLMTYTPNSATFNGNIYAANLDYNGITNDKLSNSAVSWNKLDYGVTNVIADKATIGQLNATNAQVSNLWADNANIRNLVADKASIGQLNATNAQVSNLSATKANLTYVTSEFTKTQNLIANKASISQLNSASARINNLEGDVANFKKTFTISGSTVFINAFSIDTRYLHVETLDIGGSFLSKQYATFVTSIKGGTATYDSITYWGS